MIRLRDLPVRRKLMLIIMGTVVAALALAAVVAVTQQLREHRKNLAVDLATTAQMAGDAGAAAIAFDDPAAARNALEALAADPHIVAAALYDERGRVFAGWQAQAPDGAPAPPPPAAMPDGHRFGDNSLEVFRTLTVAGEKIGGVYVRANLEELNAAKRSYARTVVLAIAVALTIAYLMSNWLQRVVTDPIARLASTVAIVARTKDYSARSPAGAKDEFGQLVAGFNEMLDQIEARDRALRDARDHLERRVAERTTELQRESETVRVSEERFRTLVTATADIVWTSDASGKSLADVPAWRKFTGQSEDEVRGYGWANAIHPDDRPRVHRLRQQAVTAGSLFEAEYRARRHDGQYRDFLARGAPIKAPDGTIREWVGVSTDVTARKQSEAALAAAQRELLDVTRQAGMAEIATNVLHNVGNALNSVNVSAGLIRSTLKKDTAAALGRVVDLLRAHERDLGAFLTGDAQGRQVLPYLAQVAAACRADHVGISGELGALTDNIDHIKEVVATQQQYARVGAVEESVSLPSLVEDCLKMNVDSLARHGVQVVREFQDLPPMHVERHKLLQILMNLLTNARHACVESNHADPRMVVRVTKANGTVRIEVADNGVGIPAENLTRIFEHGFTARQSGHGFGLHGSALAAKTMGGSLTAHSDGPGQGATFTLELPA